MNVRAAAEMIQGTIVVGGAEASTREVLGGYVSDLLSDVMGNGREGDLWVTLQRHINIVAVAQLHGLAGIVLVNGRQPEPDTAIRAAEEGVVLVSTPLPAFDVVGILFGLGIRGRRPL